MLSCLLSGSKPFMKVRRESVDVSTIWSPVVLLSDWRSTVASTTVTVSMWHHCMNMCQCHCVHIIIGIPLAFASVDLDFNLWRDEACFCFVGDECGSFYRRGRTRQKRSIKRGRARAQVRARTRIRREQGTSKSRGEIDRTISRIANRRSLSIDRLVKVYKAISSSSSSTSTSRRNFNFKFQLQLLW